MDIVGLEWSEQIQSVCSLHSSPSTADLAKMRFLPTSLLVYRTKAHTPSFPSSLVLGTQPLLDPDSLFSPCDITVLRQKNLCWGSVFCTCSFSSWHGVQQIFKYFFIADIEIGHMFSLRQVCLKCDSEVCFESGRFKRRLKKEHWNLCFSVYLPYIGVNEMCGAECYKLQYATRYQINDMYSGLS